MATSIELFDLYQNAELKKRVLVRTTIVAYTIALDGGQGMQARKEWAKATLENPSLAAARMLVAVLAAHEELEVDEIIALTDEELVVTITEAVVAFE